MWIIYVPREDATLKKLAEAWEPVRSSKGEQKKNDDNRDQHSQIDAKHRVAVVQYPDAIQHADTLSHADVVYVFGGHCTAASENVTWPDNSKNPLKFDMVADRLMSAGLKKEFAGAIKVYSCQSGVGGEEAFGTRLASYMRSKGFNCNFWAYTGNISTSYINTQPADSAPMKEKMQARTINENIREQGGIHRFMQLVVGRPYTARAKDSKNLV